MEHVDAYARHVQSLEARVAKLTRESFALDAQLARLRQAPVPAASSVLFQPFTSKPDATFFKELGERKLSTYMLSEDPVPVRAVYALPQQAEHAWLELDASAFQAALPAANSGEWACAGTLLVVNTLETFKNTDKQALLQRAGQAAQDQLAKGDLSYLSSFVCLVHADIKSHRYLYWFAFVAPQFARPVAMPSPPVLLADAMPGAFARLAALEHVPAYFFWSASSPPAQGGVLDLALWDPQHPLPGEREEVVLGFADPSGSLNPGWPLRNLLHYVANRLPAKTVVKIIAVRDRITHAMQASPSAWAGSKPSKSLLFTVQLPDKEQQQLAEEAAPRFLGWEPNEKNKMGPRLVDLSSMLDPDKLSETAGEY
jgi:ubiquitin-like modifier-activating enzyme ATG7